MGPTTTSSALGPGVGAFIAFFLLAVALYFLMRNMNGRMRRMAYRERDRVAALEAQVDGGSEGASAGGGAAASPAGSADGMPPTPTDAP